MIAGAISISRTGVRTFDPIAIRFSRTQKDLTVELSVMPLIAGTDYRDFIDITKGAAVSAQAGDR